MELPKVEFSTFDDKSSTEEVRPAIEPVNVDITETENSETEVLVSLEDAFEEVASVEVVTPVEETANGAEGVAKKVVD